MATAGVRQVLAITMYAGSGGSTPYHREPISGQPR